MKKILIFLFMIMCLCGCGCNKQTTNTPKGEVAKLEDKQKEAKEQIERYSSFEDIKDIQGLRKYTIVVATNDIYVEEIV